MEVIKVKPYKAVPALKERIWGGQRLKQYNKSFEGVNIGESWETDKDTMPVLIKLIDANDILSVQVHPNDAMAWELEGQSYGKTEAWIVLDCDENAELVAGIRQGTTPTQLENAIAQGKIQELLNITKVKKGDCIYIPAGTVHSLGKGLLIYEVQQPSDLTYRLYDWNRVDSKGEPRELHIEKALRSLNYDAGELEIKNLYKPMTNSKCCNVIFDNQYFTTYHIVLEEAQGYCINCCGFSALTMISGVANITSEAGIEQIFKGDTWIITEACELRLFAEEDSQFVLTTYPSNKTLTCI
jgi:mannose-6-phosphate isomerase